MRGCITQWALRWLITVVIAASLAAEVAAIAFAQTNAAPANSSLAVEEREACTKNLKLIYQAIQAYQISHKDLPNWLSDLVPEYLSDANVLICPVCRRTGKTEAPPMADPKIPSSYLFEFSPVPLGQSASNAPTHTRREWKRRQMSLLGSVVPVVRCRFHDPTLNLAFDGRVYDSPPMWESLYTNRFSAAELTADQLFANEPKLEPKIETRRTFPPRSSKATSELLDLTQFYNAMLTESWLGANKGNLASLRGGLQALAGIRFDARGIIQLGSKSLDDRRYPTQIKAIPVHQNCKRLHFLHATGLAQPSDEGNQVGSYVIHFTGNPAPLVLPLFYGREVRDWHPFPDEPPHRELILAWMDQRALGGPVRLFKTTWTNPTPDDEVESIDFISTMSNPAPFLVAITAE